MEEFLVTKGCSEDLRKRLLRRTLVGQDRNSGRESKSEKSSNQSYTPARMLRLLVRQPWYQDSSPSGACYAFPDVDYLHYEFVCECLPKNDLYETICKLCARSTVDPDENTDASATSSSSLEPGLE